MSTQLLPCPFCGREPKHTTRAGGQVDGYKFVSFLACMCGGYTAHAHHGAGADTAEEAARIVAEKWNTRASPPDRDAIIEMCARVAERRSFPWTGPSHGAWERGYLTAAADIASSIRALSPHLLDRQGEEGK